MPRPTPTLWPLEPHSRIKHEILRQYINAWLPIMTRGSQRVVIVDGFAGPGEYSGGEPGSPLIMLNSCLGHRDNPSSRSVVVFQFIEEWPDRASHLQQLINRLGEMPKHVKVDVVSGRYEAHFSRLLDGLMGTGEGLAPTFAFIDPFGYSQASMTLTGKFLQFRRCEVLVYMPLPFVSRFVDLNGQEPAMDSLFGCEDWRAARRVRGEARRNCLRDLFEKQLRASGSEFVERFEIETRGGGGYYLFFGTTHLKGVERMRAVLWKMDPLQGSRYKESNDEGQSAGLPLRPSTAPLLDLLHSAFVGRMFTIQDAEAVILRDTSYRFSVGHLRPELKRAEDAGRLQVVGRSGRRKGTYPDGTAMRLST